MGPRAFGLGKAAGEVALGVDERGAWGEGSQTNRRVPVPPHKQRMSKLELKLKIQTRRSAAVRVSASETGLAPITGQDKEGDEWERPISSSAT